MRVVFVALACVSMAGCSNPGGGAAAAPQAPADPDRAMALYRQGLTVQQGGDTPGAIALFYQAIQADPGHAEVRNHLAWLRATDPDPALRDGAEALRLAEAACRIAIGKEPDAFAANGLDTLAAAQARAGRFDDAVATAGRAAEMMDSLGNRRAARSFRDREEMYRQKQPYQDR